MRTLRIRTCAKLNLYLRVLGRRRDGYHEIETVFHGIGLCDDLELTSAEHGGVRLDAAPAPGTVAPLPPPESNLIARAARLLLDVSGGDLGVKARLTKRVPIGAGLGGGSANAAGALVALNELWGCGLSHDSLRSAAAMLGSDVAYCLSGGTALGTSRGERLTPLVSAVPLWFVLGISHEPLWTAEVYARWRKSDAPEPGSAPLARALAAGDVARIGSLLHNDLEPAVFSLRPELRAAKGLLVDAGALGACVSGSGPTLFGIARDAAHARALAADTSDAFDRVEAVTSVPECVQRVD